MYRGNRILVDHAQRLTEERVARSELLSRVPAEDRILRRIFSSLPRLDAGAAHSISFDLETTSG